MNTEDNIRKHLSKKFNDFEAIPQDQTWEQIRVALDLKDKFNTYEAEPQASSWDNILLANQLGEKFKDYETEPQAETNENILLATTLADKFRNYEVEPQDELEQTILLAAQLSEKFKEYEVEPTEETNTNIFLKTQLAEKFSHFEAEPQTQSWETIKANIKQEEDEKPIVFFPFFSRIGIAASIVLLLGIAWLFFKNQTKPTELARVKVENSKQNVAKEKSPPYRGGLGGVIIQIAKQNTIKDKYKPETQNNIAVEPIKQDPIHTNINEKPILENAQNENDVAVTKATNDGSNLVEIQAKTLALLASKEIKVVAVNKPFGQIGFNNELPFQEKAEKVRRNFIFTTSLMPLQTYQALTILPQTTTYIQQVASLNAIDAQRLGIQARFGIMKPLSNRFTTGISLAYAGVQQALSYEVNTGQYEMQTTDSQNYTLVGVGQTVSQNKFLHTAGLKLDNTYLLIPKKNRLFITGGAEAIKVFSQNQYGYYLNASVAFSTPIKNGKSIWIEPTYRYSLSQSLDANSYVQIRPSTLGLNVRFNFM